MIATPLKLLTAEEFTALPQPLDGSRQELIDGQVHTMPPAKGRHGIICQRIVRKLANWADETIGWVVSNDTGVILKRDPDTVRGPDIAYWAKSRCPELPEGYFEIPPDLVVEVLSPDDRWTVVQRKVRDYLSAGVAWIWLVDPELRVITMYAGDTAGTELGSETTIDGGTVLPGFTCQVAEFFA